MKDNDSGMKAYYQARAEVYDRVYRYPERQQDLRVLEQTIPKLLRGRNVLEVAAGTGYWTQFIASEAKSILAVDVTVETLNQIKQRPGTDEVVCRQHDAYALHELQQQFDGAFAGLWLSHVPKQKLTAFMHSFHGCLLPGAQVVLLDNSAAQCERLPLSHRDSFGNSYQDRELDDGSVHRVLKNFPVEAELVVLAGRHARNMDYTSLAHFWLFQYRWYGT